MKGFFPPFLGDEFIDKKSYSISNYYLFTLKKRVFLCPIFPRISCRVEGIYRTGIDSEKKPPKEN